MKQIFSLIALFRPFWGWAVLGIVLSTITMLASITLLTTSAWFITAMGVAGLAGVSMNYFTPAAIIRGCAIVRTAGRYVERLVTHEATFRFLGELRVKTFRNFANATLEEIEQHHSADLTSRIQYDIEALQGFYVRILVPITASLFAALSCLLYLLQYELSLFITISSGLFLAGIVLPIFAYRHVSRNANDLSKTAERLKGQTVDMLDGLGDLIIFRGLTTARSTFSDAITQRILAVSTDETVALIIKNVIWLISQLTFIATIILAASLLQQNHLSQANFVLISMFAVACFESIGQIAPAIMLIPQTRSATDRVFTFDDHPNALNTPQTEDVHTTDLNIQNVVFTYKGLSSRRMQFDFRLPAGQKVLIKGPSGIGKSTLIDLLVAQRHPQSGTISLNNVPLRDMTPTQLVSSFSVAPQTTHIFTGTLLENLTLGCQSCSIEEITKVLDICELTTLVDSLTERLDTHIGEQGYNLSGGQIRRIGVARALLKPSPILILDEPTEGLDPDTATRMMTNIVSTLDGRSLIVISHQDIQQDIETIYIE